MADDTESVLRSAAGATNAQLASLDRQVARLTIRANDLSQRLAEEMASHQATRQRLEAIERSAVWRASAPLRAVAVRFPWAGRMARRMAKLVWWTLTGRLGAQFGAWRQARRAARGVEQLRRPPVALPPPQAGEIVVPAAADPEISVIISTYGQVEATLKCLASIMRYPPRRGIEVIVVDDAYPGPEDLTPLGEVRGIGLVRNETNLGFLRSCNRAAGMARGRYLHMLNNDTELEPDAIDALADLLEARPDAGIAGSKLLFPDGVLQEAGGILWADGSAWNYGRGQDPARPEFNYVREADYCSGASLLVRRGDFAALGGFDELFVPAYCEDADLAFRMRASGRKVLYEPRSVVIHHEGMSHGTDLTAGVKAHQVINSARLRERWSVILASEHFANGRHVLRARDRAAARRVTLVIDHYVPQHDRDAGSRTIAGLLESLVEAGWSVKFRPMNGRFDAAYTPGLEAMGIEVVDDRFPGAFDDWLRENGEDIDHVLASRPEVAEAVLPALLRRTQAVLSYYGHDLHFARMAQQARQSGDEVLARRAVEMEALERRVWAHFDIVLYPSEEEAVVVRGMAPGRLVRAIVPYRFEIAPARAQAPGSLQILMVAGFAHAPNVDAALFLVNEILPLLRARLGQVKVTLVGSNPTDRVRALAGPDVEVTGYVSDAALAGLYATARVSVVPLRFGAGVKGKVVEALCHGVPVVTTPVGAQGIPGLGDCVPVHERAADLADAIARLLTDDAAWLAQSAAQRELALDRFSRAAMRESIVGALAEAERDTGR